MKLWFVLVAVLLLAAPAVCWPVPNGVGAGQAKTELRPLSLIKLRDLNGKVIAPDGLKGKVVVLDFWATWCGPCISEVPTWNRLHEKYADKGVEVIGVTMASGEAKDVKAMVAKAKMKYTVVMGDDDQTADFNVLAFPTTFIVTRDGKIFNRYLGAGPRKAALIEADIQKLLNTEVAERQ